MCSRSANQSYCLHHTLQCNETEIAETAKIESILLCRMVSKLWGVCSVRFKSMAHSGQFAILDACAVPSPTCAEASCTAAAVRQAIWRQK